jgi:hypothetical protein
MRAHLTGKAELFNDKEINKLKKRIEQTKKENKEQCARVRKVDKQKNPARTTGFVGFNREIRYLSRRSSSMSLNRNDLHNVRVAFNANFSVTAYDIILRRNHGPAVTFSDIEKDFALAYGIRNLGAHEIRTLPVLYNRLPEISQSILTQFSLQFKTFIERALAFYFFFTKKQVKICES